jgi:signal transduction histidine kinase
VRDEGSVGRLLSRAFGVLVALIVGCGLAQLAVLLLHDRTVGELTDRVRPLQVANAHMRTVLADAQRGMRGYLLTGDGPMLDVYYGARGEYAQISDVLRNHAAGPYRGAARAQIARADEWWALADRQRAAAPLSEQAAAYVMQDNALFDAFVRTNQGLQTDLGNRASELGRRSDTLHWSTAGVLAVLTVGATTVAVLTAIRTRRRITGPLSDVADVQNQRRAGDRDVRVPVHGPAEIRAVAEAVNATADRSEHIRRQEQHMLARLQALDNAKTDFMATVSHELRTPLTSISGYLELLRDAPPGELSDSQDRMLEVIARNTRRLRELIEDILTLSQIETGEFRSDLAEVDLAEVIQRQIAAIGPAAAKASVGLHCDVRGPLPLSGDAGQLDRVLSNLLSNAVKFTRAEGTVSVRAERRGDEVLLTVTDNGMGIPAAEQEALFARFFRASNAVKQAIPGTGLGLAIIRTIVENHEGTIEAESTENVGTTMTVRLPAQKITAGASRP